MGPGAEEIRTKGNEIRKLRSASAGCSCTAESGERTIFAIYHHLQYQPYQVAKQKCQNFMLVPVCEKSLHLLSLTERCSLTSLYEVKKKVL